MLINKQSLKSYLPFVFLGLLVIGIYYMGLFGPFMLDDHSNLAQSRLSSFSFSEIVRAMLSNTSGPLGRPLASLSFSLTSFFLGDTPFAAKCVNLMLHLANGLLIYKLSKVVLIRLSYPSADRVAYWTAALWLCHPLLVSTTLYAVQLMTLLSSFFTLCALLLYISHRDNHQIKAGVFFLFFTSLGILSKETAAASFLYVLVIEYSLFNDRKACHGALISLIAWLPITIGVLFLSSQFDSWIVYHIKKHSLPLERIITESNVLWEYVSLIFWPAPSRLNLFHDDLDIVLQLNYQTIIGILSWAMVILIAFWAKKRQPLLFFAILWFLGGHFLEATLLPIELFFEHRNYLPLMGPVLYIVTLLSGLEVVFLPSVALIIITLSSLTTYRSYIWGDSYRFAINQAVSHPLSSRANIQLANAYFSRGEMKDGLRYTDLSIAAAKDDPGYFIFKLRMSCLNNQVSAQDLMVAKHKLLIGRNYSFANLVMERLIQEIQTKHCPPLNMKVLSEFLEAVVSSPYAYLSKTQESYSYLLLARTYQNQQFYAKSLWAYGRSYELCPDRATVPLVELATLQLKLKDLNGYRLSRERLLALNQYRYPNIKDWISDLDIQAQRVY